MPAAPQQRSEPPWLSRLPPAQRALLLSGRSRLDPRRVGSIIGVVGGLVFATDYSGFLSVLGRASVVTAALLGALVTLTLLFVRPRALGRLPSVSSSAWVGYVAGVAGMLGCIAVGTRLLTDQHLDARPALVALCVGAHFLPFWLAFHERHFLDLGIALMVIGGAGLTLAVVLGWSFGSLAAVVAGLVMLALMLGYAARGRALSTRRPVLTP